MALWAGCRHSDPLLPLITEPPSPAAYESLTAVTANTDIPIRDMVDLTTRFRSLTPPRVAQTEPAAFQVGDTAEFWVKDLDNDGNKQVEATLIYRSEALNMWLEFGKRVSEKDMTTAAHFIENQILPTNRAFFGTEWQPGVDGDNRINILHLGEVGGVGVAYFWSGNEYVTAVNPYSNQREMLTISLKHGPVGSDEYYRSIAHELQHLIQWRTDPNEAAWLGEGLSELAVHINGFDTDRAESYAGHTDIQLNAFSQEPDVIAAHYAAATLFSIYFLDRFGDEATQSLVQHPANGAAGFNQLLADLNTGLSFDDLFADWLAANYLDGAGRSAGVYGYSNLELTPIKPETMRRFPAAVTAVVNQYGADYYRLESKVPITISFTGSQQVSLVNTAPHSGRAFWMSLPADEADSHLTRRFDLTGLDSATLSFWTWYEIEAGWDYAYVAMSLDDGRSWQLLETQSTTQDNPQGNSFGPGYTGISGGGDAPIWTQETADLTPFVGQSILVRFEYITDDAVHEQGFLLDDITIPELQFLDNAETANDWEAAGFVRTGHILPQSFIVQRILIDSEEVQVERLPLDENQHGQFLFPMDKEADTAILIISGNSPVTTQPAVYTFKIEQ